MPFQVCPGSLGSGPVTRRDRESFGRSSCGRHELGPLDPRGSWALVCLLGTLVVICGNQTPFMSGDTISVAVEQNRSYNRA